MNRIEREKRTVAIMIKLYCHRHEHNRTLCPQGVDSRSLCPECAQLLEYATARLEHCPHANGKPACRDCHTHCYRPDMRRRIQAVMRWSGPRMMLYHPVIAIRHLLKI